NNRQRRRNRGLHLLLKLWLGGRYRRLIEFQCLRQCGYTVIGGGDLFDFVPNNLLQLELFAIRICAHRWFRQRCSDVYHLIRDLFARFLRNWISKIVESGWFKIELGSVTPFRGSRELHELRGLDRKAPLLPSGFSGPQRGLADGRKMHV